MMIEFAIGENPPLPERGFPPAEGKRSWLGALWRWRAARKTRAAALRLQRTLQTYPDYLLKDMGFAPSGCVRCTEQMFNRF